MQCERHHRLRTVVALGAHVHLRGPVRASEHNGDGDADVHVSRHRPHHDAGPFAVPASRAADPNHHDRANLHDVDRPLEHAADRIEHAMVARLRLRAPVFRAAIEHEHLNARVPGRTDRQPSAVHRLRHHGHDDAHVGVSVARRAGDVHRQHGDAKPLRARVRAAVAFDANAMRGHAAIRRVPGRDDTGRTRVPTARCARSDVRGADRFRHVGRMVDHDDAVQRIQHLCVPAATTVRSYAESAHHAVWRMSRQSDGLAAIADLYGERVSGRGWSDDVELQRRMDTGDCAAQLLAPRVPAATPELHRRDRGLHRVRRVHRRGPVVFLHGNEIVPRGVQRIEHELQEHVARRSRRRVRHLGCVAGVHARLRVYGQSAELHVAVRADDHARLSGRRKSDGRSVAARHVSELDVFGRHVSAQPAELYLASRTDDNARVSVGRQSNRWHVGSCRDVPGLVVQRRCVRAATAAAPGRCHVHHALARRLRRPVRYAVRRLLPHLPRANPVRRWLPADGWVQRVHHQDRRQLQHQHRHLRLCKPIPVEHGLAAHRPRDPVARMPDGRRQHLQPGLQRDATRGGEVPANGNNHHDKLFHRLRAGEHSLKAGRCPFAG